MTQAKAPAAATTREDTAAGARFTAPYQAGTSPGGTLASYAQGTQTPVTSMPRTVIRRPSRRRSCLLSRYLSSNLAYWEGSL